MGQADVVVVGGGPAGALIGLRLSRAGLRVQIIDPQFPRRRPAETLSPEGRRILSLAAIWDRLPTGVAAACPAVVAAWEQAEPTSRSFITNPYGHAWHVDRAQFDQWLLSEAAASGAGLMIGIARDIRRNKQGWIVDVALTDRDAHVTANFLVIATGRYSALTRLSHRERAEALCVVGGFVKPTTDADDTLLVEAGPDGWWYSIPAQDGRLFAGWVTDAAILRRRRCGDAMNLALTRAPLTRARLADPPPVVCTAMAMSAMRPCAGEGWLAIGDAALSRDPLSGDGLASALRSAWDGAKVILDATEGDRSVWQLGSIRGDAEVADYRRHRAIAYEAVMHRWPAEPFWSTRRDR